MERRPPRQVLNAAADLPQRRGAEPLQPLSGIATLHSLGMKTVEFLGGHVIVHMTRHSPRGPTVGAQISGESGALLRQSRGHPHGSTAGLSWRPSSTPRPYVALVYLVYHVAHMRSVGDVRNVSRMEIDRFDPTPIYRQVAAVVRERIRSGELRPRDPIPSESSMVADHGIARDTARAAVALLREEGYVITLPQRGTYVAPRENWPAD